MNNDRRKNKKYNPLGVIAAIVIVFLVEFADSAEGLGILIFIAVIVGIAVLLVRKLKPKATGTGKHRAAAQRRQARKLCTGDPFPL